MSDPLKELEQLSEELMAADAGIDPNFIDEVAVNLQSSGLTPESDSSKKSEVIVVNESPDKSDDVVVVSVETPRKDQVSVTVTAQAESDKQANELDETVIFPLNQVSAIQQSEPASAYELTLADMFDEECESADSVPCSDVSDREDESPSDRETRQKAKKWARHEAYWDKKAEKNKLFFEMTTNRTISDNVKAAIRLNFIESSYKIELTGIERHKYTDYMLELLRNGETTILETGSAPEEMEDFFTPAINMIELIKQGRYSPYIDQRGETVLMPFGYKDVRRIDDYVRQLPVNSHLAEFTRRFPYIPVNHDLPRLDLVPGDYDFENWNPPLPTKENWRTFRYAPSNIRCDGKSWAANCRHEVSDWDEHPWCKSCLVAADIQPCKSEDACYICELMPTNPKKLFKMRLKYGLDLKAKNKKSDSDGATKAPAVIAVSETAANPADKTLPSESPTVTTPTVTPPVVPVVTPVKARTLRSEIRTQIHANYLTLLKDVNPYITGEANKKKQEKGAEKKKSDKPFRRYLGFCRPGWLVPIYWSRQEFFGMPAGIHHTHVGEQLVAFEREYEYLRAGRKSLLWIDLEDMRIKQKEADISQPKLASRSLKQGTVPLRTDGKQSPAFVKSPTSAVIALAKRDATKKGAARKASQRTVVSVPVDDNSSDEDYTPTKLKVVLASGKSRLSQRKRSEPETSPTGIAGRDDHVSDSDNLHLEKEGTGMGGLAPWSNVNWMGAIPQGTVRRDFDYEAATVAATKIRQVEMKPEVVEQLSEDCAMFSYKRRKRNRQYQPSSRYHRIVNKTLSYYSNSAVDPEFPETIPADLADYPEGIVRASPQIPSPDAGNNFPADTDSLEITQKEICRLDALARALVKIHENDCMAVNTMQIRIDQLEAELRQQQGIHYDESNQAVVMSAVSKNCAVREEVCAELLGIVLAVRRRDNAIRKDPTPAVISRMVSAPLYKTLMTGEPIEEELQLLD